MRRPWIVLAVLVSGCASTGIEPAALDQPLQTGSVAQQADAGDAARSHVRTIQHKAVQDARKPGTVFLAEKGSNCASPKLKEAIRRITDTTTALAATMRPDYSAMLDAGTVALEIADGAKGKGCTREAKQLYDFVLKHFSGLGYAELRDRATSGLRELKTRREPGGAPIAG
ncbi:MAG TPA: hypothetical protein VJ740_00605 [Hyphomicrobiaceae bacterium]|nr:hypothetical protein [Hyphomicrobiaceae bacterium]